MEVPMALIFVSTRAGASSWPTRLKPLTPKAGGILDPGSRLSLMAETKIIAPLR